MTVVAIAALHELPAGWLRAYGSVRTIEDAEKIAAGRRGWWFRNNFTLYVEDMK